MSALGRYTISQGVCCSIDICMSEESLRHSGGPMRSILIPEDE